MEEVFDEALMRNANDGKKYSSEKRPGVKGNASRKRTKLRMLYP